MTTEIELFAFRLDEHGTTPLGERRLMSNLKIGRPHNAMLQDENRFWAIDHGGLSRIHCAFVRRGNSVFVKDAQSRNGTRINGAARLTPGQECEIQAGDRILLGQMIELRVRVPPQRPADTALVGETAMQSKRNRPHAVDEILGNTLPDSTGHDAKVPWFDLPVTADDGDRWTDIPEDWPEEAAFSPPEPDEPAAPSPDQNVAWTKTADPGPGTEQTGNILATDGWHREDDAPVDPHPALDPPETAGADVVSTGGRKALYAFLRGAKIDPARFEGADIEAVLERAGKLYRQSVLNHIHFLDDRRTLKRQHDIEETGMNIAASNPLKVEDESTAAVLMLKPPIAGAMEGQAAMRDAGKDIKSHQLATVAGMERALLAIIEAMAPDRAEASVCEIRFDIAGLRTDKAILSLLRKIHDDLSAEVKSRRCATIAAAFRTGYDEMVGVLDQGRKARQGQTASRQPSRSSGGTR